MSLDPYKNDDGELMPYAFPGGYPIAYYTSEGHTFCPECATESLNDEDIKYRAQFADINWEDNSQYCDECGQQIESAYGDDE
jgi:hypothetical protein